MVDEVFDRWEPAIYPVYQDMEYSEICRASMQAAGGTVDIALNNGEY